MTLDRLFRCALTAAMCVLLASGCSTTKSIPEDDQLFTGLTAIDYKLTPDSTHARGSLSLTSHLSATQEEIEAALATAPNGALFGSSFYRSPLPVGLWVWNSYSQKDSPFSKWMTRSFGSTPVLMSQVNPELRASVARSVLRKNGYFSGTVAYQTVVQKNPRKAKIGYTVTPGPLTTVDSMDYVGFPEPMRRLIDSTRSEALIARDAPLAVSRLDAERTRLSSLFRQSGYYYFSPAYTTFLADTFQLPGKAMLRLQLADSVPPEALRPYYIGNIEVQLRRSFMETATDTLSRRHLKLLYSGRRAPIRPRVVLRDLMLRPRRLFSYDNYQESVQKLNATGVFSTVDLQLAPRQAAADTLDVRLTCTFDKPYDFYFEANAVGRTTGRVGPEMKIGFTRRNVFRGAERLDVNLHGAYQWYTGGGDRSMNSYQYGADASIEFPRIVAPLIVSEKVRRTSDGRIRPRRRPYATPTTLAKASTDVVHRPKYYRMHIVSGEWTYKWQPSASSRHEFSPLTLKYQFLNSHTTAFDSLLAASPYLQTTMSDLFIPKMRYTYVYVSPSSRLHPIRWETTVEQAGCLTALFDVLVQGNGWNQKGKTLFKNPYSQFLRIETDFTKTWRIDRGTSLVGHVSAGLIRPFGNSADAPFSERFYAGGANSVRAFTVHSIGPGAFVSAGTSKQLSYLMQNGEIKFVANLEYRTPLFGSLAGAVFLDAGNVWNWKSELGSESRLRFSDIADQIALGTGMGLRYDLDFLIVRLDWGFALHAPYDTGRSAYFNLRHFRDMHSLHFAIGYPF